MVWEWGQEVWEWGDTGSGHETNETVEPKKCRCKSLVPRPCPVFCCWAGPGNKAKVSEQQSIQLYTMMRKTVKSYLKLSECVKVEIPEKQIEDILILPSGYIISPQSPVHPPVCHSA